MVILRKSIGIVFTAVYIAAVLTAVFIIYYNIRLPDRFYVETGGSLEFDSGLIVPANSAVSNVPVGGGDTSVRSAQLKLLGIFPIKNVDICEVGRCEVVPCGTPFGIKMLTDGVMVVDISGFRSGNEIVSPAADAGIRKGDIILSISGRKVKGNDDISGIISSGGGKTVGVRIMRSQTQSVVFIKPERSSDDGCYHAGMWVRDSSAGIGTMTFYDPVSGCFAGLGHPVCDIDTGEILPLYSGEMNEVVINGVKKGEPGVPGELVGTFVSDKPDGTLLMNCREGLYGRAFSPPVYAEPVAVAMRQEISAGDAYICSTVKGCAPKYYSIKIEKIDLSDSEGRNMIIKVTDKELIDEAGGIVQGMSGSPIIRDGKLIGAVTHVFVNDPQKGYAIFADTMYEKFGSIISAGQNAA